MKQRLELAKLLARRAGALLREGYQQDTEVDLKGEIDLLTEYDLRSEELLIDGIRSTFPQDAILAEESGGQSGSEVQWLIDPLDGTTNFSHGVPIFAVSIACRRAEQILCGVVYDPMRNDLFHAELDGGAWLNDTAINVSATATLDESLLATGFPYDIRSNPETNLDHFAAFKLRARGVRRLGAAALDLAYVAAGRFDGYWEMRLWPWDWSAGILIVREAGGTVTRMDGGPDVFREPTSMLASNGRIHHQMLDVLQRHG
jgi:myo-inositol-1(or 4)-monophosphatase